MALRVWEETTRSCPSVFPRLRRLKGTFKSALCAFVFWEGIPYGLIIPYFRFVCKHEFRVNHIQSVLIARICVFSFPSLGKEQTQTSKEEKETPRTQIEPKISQHEEVLLFFYGCVCTCCFFSCFKNEKKYSRLVLSLLYSVRRENDLRITATTITTTRFPPWRTIWVPSRTV